jgi:hypothetical protein
MGYKQGKYTTQAQQGSLPQVIDSKLAEGQLQKVVSIIALHSVSESVFFFHKMFFPLTVIYDMVTEKKRLAPEGKMVARKEEEEWQPQKKDVGEGFNFVVGHDGGLLCASYREGSSCMHTMATNLPLIFQCVMLSILNLSDETLQIF